MRAATSISAPSVTAQVEPDAALIPKLFPSLAEGELAERYFPGKMWLLDEGPLERIPGIIDAFLRPDLKGLLDLSNHDVIAYANGGNGERPYTRVPKSAAMFVQQQGMSLEVQYLNESVPCVAAWLESLVRELGVPGGKSIFCCAIVSPPGEALPVHFDDIEVISLQLSGRKRWWIAPPDEGGRFPLQNSFDRARRRDAYPLAIPELSGPPTLEMRRGSVVFLPRGFWHRTEALEPSVNLVFVIDTPMAFEVALEALRAKMLERTDWRRTVAGKAREQTRTTTAAALEGSLDRLLDELQRAWSSP